MRGTRRRDRGPIAIGIIPATWTLAKAKRARNFFFVELNSQTGWFQIWRGWEFFKCQILDLTTQGHHHRVAQGPRSDPAASDRNVNMLEFTRGERGKSEQDGWSIEGH